MGGGAGKDCEMGLRETMRNRLCSCSVNPSVSTM